MFITYSTSLKASKTFIHIITGEYRPPALQFQIRFEPITRKVFKISNLNAIRKGTCFIGS